MAGGPGVNSCAWAVPHRASASPAAAPAMAPVMTPTAAPSLPGGRHRAGTVAARKSLACRSSTSGGTCSAGATALFLQAHQPLDLRQRDQLGVDGRQVALGAQL